MEDTVQNNNNSGATFSYPDFSTNQPSTPVQSTPLQSDISTDQSGAMTTTGLQQSDEDELAKLKKSLNDLLEKEEVVDSAPLSSPTTLSSTDNEINSGSENFVQNTDSSSIQTTSVPEKKYTQEVTPLPGLNDTQTITNKEEDVSEVFNLDNSVKPKSVDSLPTYVSPIDTGSLESIIPDLKKPKAMDRNPKINNLASPIKNPDEIKDSLKNGNNSNEDKSTTASEINSQSKLTIFKLLAEAVNRNASDLHLSVGYPPILRIDGNLVDLEEKILNPEDVEELIFAVLSDEKKELLEVNREIDFAYMYEGAVSSRFRVNAYYSMKNLSAAFRLIPSRVRTIEELMLPQLYHQLTKLKQGLVLVTGPTGHGKSTTLAAFLEDINRSRFCHIVTIEDPVEYVFEGNKSLIDQREMNDDTHSWSIALRSALRQDPDVILVGEMRDYETIAAAITLAETGHLVFATLHTNSAAQTIDRIIDVFPENQQQQVRAQIANTLEAVIAQRLIPLDKGGRRAVSEIMLNNSAVANLIREGKTHQLDNVIRTSSDVGMIYLEKSLVSLVREGVITVQKAQEYAVHPEEVLRLLKA